MGVIKNISLRLAYDGTELRLSTTVVSAVGTATCGRGLIGYLR